MRTDFERGYDFGFTDKFFFAITKARKELIIKILKKQDKLTDDIYKNINEISDLDKLEEILDNLI